LDRFLAGLGHRPRAVTGLAVVLLAVLWLTRLHEDSGYATGMLGPTTLLGIGVGLALVPLNLTILATTRPEDTGVTAG
ncbi:MFS transporter, partial [Streptomyces sp. CHA15]|nr:MFS transporter [Streptomyces sp. CHA15]